MRPMQNLHRTIASTAPAALILMLLAAAQVSAQVKFLKKTAKPSQTQTSLDNYSKSVRALGTEGIHTTGSLWSASAVMANPATDYKARSAGDVLIIRVVDNFSATASGTAQAQRTFSASSSVSNLLGAIPSTSPWQNLFSPASTQNLDGKGQSALTSTLSLNLAGRVVEALPNGVLVVEAMRDLTVGNDRQTIVLRGLVRPGDIASDGSVLSSDIANLEAEIHGKGVVADAIHRPNVIVRALLMVLGL